MFWWGWCCSICVMLCISLLVILSFFWSFLVSRMKLAWHSPHALPTITTDPPQSKGNPKSSTSWQPEQYCKDSDLQVLSLLVTMLYTNGMTNVITLPNKIAFILLYFFHRCKHWMYKYCVHLDLSRWLFTSNPSTMDRAWYLYANIRRVWLRGSYHECAKRMWQPNFLFFYCNKL